MAAVDDDYASRHIRACLRGEQQEWTLKLS
jgi:hypothetical protein